MNKNYIGKFILILGILCVSLMGCRSSEKEYLQREAQALRDEIYWLKKELMALDNADVAYSKYMKTEEDDDYEIYLDKKDEWLRLREENDSKGYH